MTGTRETAGHELAEKTCLVCAVRNPKSPQTFGDDVLTELVAGYLRDHRYQRGGGESKVDRGDEYRAATLVHLVLGHSAEVERLRAVEVGERQCCGEQAQGINGYRQEWAARGAAAALVEDAARDLRGGPPTDTDRSDVTRVLTFLHGRGMLPDIQPPPAGHARRVRRTEAHQGQERKP